jgi:hypothetical protein
VLWWEALALVSAAGAVGVEDYSAGLSRLTSTKEAVWQRRMSAPNDDAEFVATRTYRHLRDRWFHDAELAN